MNIKINLSETKSVSQNAEKQTKSEGNEKKNSSKGKGNVEVTNSKENNEKSKPEPKKKKAETVLSENNQNVANVPKAPIKEKGSNDTAKVAPTDPPKEQRAKREAPAKKAQGEQPVVKKEPKVVDVKPKAVQQKAPSVEQAPPVKEEPKVAVMPKEIKKQISSVTSSPASAKGGKKKKSDLSAILALGEFYLFITSYFRQCGCFSGLSCS